MSTTQFPAEKEMEQKETAPTFSLDTLSFIEANPSFGTQPENLTEIDKIDAENLLKIGLGGEDQRRYLFLTETEREDYIKTVAKIKNKYIGGGNPKRELEAFTAIDNKDQLEYIITVARRDEFLNFLTGAMMDAQIVDSNPDSKSLDGINLKKRGFKTYQELADFFRVDDRTSLIIDDIKSSIPYEEEDDEQERVKKAKKAYFAFSYFNYLFSKESPDRQAVISKLGLPESLPYFSRQKQEEDSVLGNIRNAANKYIVQRKINLPISVAA